MKRSYLGENEKADDEAHTIHNPLVKDPQESHDGVTPAAADHQASAPAQAPVTVTQSASTPPPEPQEPPASTAPRASVPLDNQAMNDKHGC